MDKKELRKQIRELKKQYSLDMRKEKSLTVCKQIEEREVFQKARIVLAYWSMPDEVFTHDFICKWSDEKIFLLPCVRGSELDIRCFSGVENLEPGEGFAIPEPVGELFTDWNRIDLILVPGMAFDKQGNRLGRGKGYYDKILKHIPAYKIGLCFDFQEVPNVPMEEFDVRMDQVIVSQ